MGPASLEQAGFVGTESGVVQLQWDRLGYEVVKASSHLARVCFRSCPSPFKKIVFGPEASRALKLSFHSNVAGLPRLERAGLVSTEPWMQLLHMLASDTEPSCRVLAPEILFGQKRQATLDTEPSS